MTAKVDFTRQAFFAISRRHRKAAGVGSGGGRPRFPSSVLTDNETFTMQKEDGARVRHYGP